MLVGLWKNYFDAGKQRSKSTHTHTHIYTHTYTLVVYSSQVNTTHYTQPHTLVVVFEYFFNDVFWRTLSSSSSLLLPPPLHRCASSPTLYTPPLPLVPASLISVKLVWKTYRSRQNECRLQLPHPSHSTTLQPCFVDKRDSCGKFRF